MYRRERMRRSGYADESEAKGVEVRNGDTGTKKVRVKAKEVPGARSAGMGERMHSSCYDLST